MPFAGVQAGMGTRRWRLPSFHVRVVDSTGAGDAFNAAFLGYLLRNQSLQDVVQSADFDHLMQNALEFGCGAGALCVATQGACVNPLTWSDVMDFLADNIEE